MNTYEPIQYIWYFACEGECDGRFISRCPTKETNLAAVSNLLIKPDTI